MMMRRMAEDIRGRLIDAVRERPILWDVDNKHYTNQSHTTANWEAVSYEIGIPALDCRKKFKNLKDTYRKKRRLVRIKKTGPAVVKAKRWGCFDDLAFLDDVIDKTEPSTYMNADYDADAADDDDDDEMDQDAFRDLHEEFSQDIKPVINRTPPAVDFQTHVHHVPHVQPVQPNFDSNEDSLYAHLVLTKLRKLDPRKKAQAKIMIDQVLFNIEFGQGGEQTAMGVQSPVPVDLWFNQAPGSGAVQAVNFDPSRVAIARPETSQATNSSESYIASVCEDNDHKSNINTSI